VYTHDTVCRYFSNKVGCIIVSVDYRKAPKHKFPIPVEDAYTALQWAVKNAHQLNGDPARVAVGGDSAGGNISAAVCLMAKDRGGPLVIFQLLSYPATDLSSLDTESYRKYGKGYDLTKKKVQQCRDAYLRNEADRFNPYASPLLAKNLRTLPPALIITGEYDVARDEGEAYAERLKQAGVQARFFRCLGIGHGAAYWAVASDTVQAALNESVSALQKVFWK
jgi:acetyl esterase